MKQLLIFKAFLLIAVVLFVAASKAPTQGILGKIAEKAKLTEKAGISAGVSAANYSWARFEVRANWTEKGRKIYETRVYYSNINNVPASNLRLKENLIGYFNEGIVEQLKARGIEINYYDSDVQIYPRSTPYTSKQEADEQMKERMEVDKSNERAIYTFVWKFDAGNASEEITQPKRIFGIKTPPAVESKAQAPDASAREAKAQAAINARDEAHRAQREKLIWGYSVLNVRVRKAGREFSRTYVSEIAPVSRADYNAFYNTDERFIKPRIWKYFAATVAKAAAERGEEIAEPYDLSISYKFSLATTGATHGGEYYEFQPKSVLDEPRRREIDYAKQSSRQVFIFRWDASGKNIQSDFDREMTRGNSADLPD